ncbi:DUF2866 domain-containing protein [Paraburkholderia fungorum]|uniref:DUF2866 domain-containing protein n=1 Tax=Paraburkholderia fungorum TaxID=134537 RepID=UPI0038B819AD
MQVSSNVSGAASRNFQSGRKTAADTAIGRKPTKRVNAPADAGKNVMKVLGCRISAPIVALWGEWCRIVEWINANGEYSCMAVPGDVTEAEIRQRVCTHRNGQRHTLTDDPGLPEQRVRLRRA